MVKSNRKNANEIKRKNFFKKLLCNKEVNKNIFLILFLEFKHIQAFPQPELMNWDDYENILPKPAGQRW